MLSRVPGHGGVVDQPTLTAVDQQPHGLVEVLGGHPVAIPEFATEVVAVASPRDIPVGCPFGVGGDLADLCHREVQGVPGLRMERLGLSEHLIDDRHTDLDALVAHGIKAPLSHADVMDPSESDELTS